MMKHAHIQLDFDVKKPNQNLDKVLATVQSKIMEFINKEIDPNIIDCDEVRAERWIES